MEVILSQDVEKLGRVGTVVKVKEGYARNFLFPRELAYPATPANLKRIEQQKAKLAAQYEAGKKQAQELAEKLAKVSLTMTVEVNDLEKMYGSVTEADILKVLESEGFKFEKKQILLDTPITDLGIFEVAVKIHPEVTAKIRLWVAKK